MSRFAYNALPARGNCRQSEGLLKLWLFDSSLTYRSPALYLMRFNGKPGDADELAIVVVSALFARFSFSRWLAVLKLYIQSKMTPVSVDIYTTCIYDYYESAEHKCTNHVITNVIRFDTEPAQLSSWRAIPPPLARAHTCSPRRRRV